MKLCKDCMYFQSDGELCSEYTSIRDLDMIYGKHTKLTALEMRKDIERCGIAAKYYKPLENEDKKPFIEGLV